MSAQACFHCGDPMPADVRLTVRIDDVEQPVCCAGCQAVAELIRDTGLTQFYRFRTEAPPRPEPSAAEREQWRVYDREALQREVARSREDGCSEADLLVDGMRCAACAWLIESTLERIDGVRAVHVNNGTGRMHLEWDPAHVPLSEVLARVARLGYTPLPVQQATIDRARARERKAATRRLFVAGLGMMQVMTYAVSMYAGAWQGMEPHILEFLRLVSLLVATPVVIYSGWPFFQRAWLDLRSRHLGMDVPVAIAIGGAYAASVWHTFLGRGEVYFDSVTMFVFFLSVGRYLEMMARHRTGDSAESLARLVPQTATRLGAEGPEAVAVAELETDDRVLVKPGEPFPADGRIADGETQVDESLLTGESRPVARGAGDEVIGGSVNLGHPVEVALTRVGGDTLLSGIARLLSRAQAERPRLVTLADHVARWFVAGILLVAACVYGYWVQVAPDRAFEITLAVLVVTCPCALSLAMPTALTVATGALARRGLLITRNTAIEALAKSSVVIFDKTGTLTEGRLRIADVRTFGSSDRQRCLGIAAALERGSEHPLARPFTETAPAGTARDARNEPGRGVEATLDGRRYRIGAASWVAELVGEAAPVGDGSADPGWTGVWLGRQGQWLARFDLADSLRDDAPGVVTSLRRIGLDPMVVSGDAPAPVRRVAEQLGIERWHAARRPEDKLSLTRELQRSGEVVAMVGDGVNDAPVLAGADVSIALSSGTGLAQTSASVVLLGHALRPLVDGLATARRTLRIIRQNLGWALGYNLTALPLAAAGWVEPWMAAIGMSASSLIVTINALRLSKRPGEADERPSAPQLRPTRA